MRYIKKSISPEPFEDWKTANPTLGYKDLSSKECTSIKDSVREALLNEQNHFCCYCGREISLKDSHIEHFRPKKIFPQLALDYQNLHFSCIKDPQNAKIYPPHCGHAKGDDFNVSQHISPLDSECETRFRYTSDGQILPLIDGDTQANYMIDLLKLNVPFLCNKRKAIQESFFREDFVLTCDEIPRLRETQSFGHVLAYFAEQLLPPMENNE